RPLRRRRGALARRGLHPARPRPRRRPAARRSAPSRRRDLRPRLRRAERRRPLGRVAGAPRPRSRARRKRARAPARPRRARAARYVDAAHNHLDAFHLETEVIGLGPVNTTREEGLRVAALFRERGWHRVVLVTSPVHSRRAAGVFEALGLEVISAPTREAKYDLEGLDSSDDRLRAFPDILHERLGLWIYRRRGWVDP